MILCEKHYTHVDGFVTVAEAEATKKEVRGSEAALGRHFVLNLQYRKGRATAINRVEIVPNRSTI